MGRLIQATSTLIVLATVFMLYSAIDVEQFSSPNDILPMTFAHADHGTENCLQCHHNFLDDTGRGSCINCHQKDSSVNLLIRDQFHDLCMGCHMDRISEGMPAGPLRICDDCHTVDQLP
ncbi:MAG: putative CXXCH cytochrome family protein [Neolewinella sp.]|jgi:predicted CXXCH cytochrome family protein